LYAQEEDIRMSFIRHDLETQSGVLEQKEILLVNKIQQLSKDAQTKKVTTATVLLY
jgi:1,4-dihydroxy-2-naphthoate octaprenyltransferase